MADENNPETVNEQVTDSVAPAAAEAAPKVRIRLTSRFPSPEKPGGTVGRKVTNNSLVQVPT